MQTQHFTITIDTSVQKVRDTMLNHPTYEQRTTVFSEWSTYQGSREKGADIKFWDTSWQGMIASIADNRLYEYISIAHKWEMMLNQQTGEMETKMYDGASFENYTFIKLSDTQTKLDVELTAIPDEYADMMNEMRPKALEWLKNLCESDMSNV